MRYADMPIGATVIIKGRPHQRRVVMGHAGHLILLAGIGPDIPAAAMTRHQVTLITHPDDAPEWAEAGAPPPFDR